MRIKATIAAIVIFAVFVIGIGVTMIFGWWTTEGNKVPVTIKSGEFAGEYNPADIRGSYSLLNISDAFGIDTATLAKAFGLAGQEDYDNIQVKILEETFEANESGEIGTDSVRWFTAMYLGMPYSPEEGTAFLNSAISILRKEGKMSAEELAEASSHIYEHDGELPTGTLTSAAPSEDHEEEADDTTIKGKTTFNDLLTWGLDKAAIEEVLGMSMGNRVQTVRDFCLANEIEFSTVKLPLQELIDALN